MILVPMIKNLSNNDKLVVFRDVQSQGPQKLQNQNIMLSRINCTTSSSLNSSKISNESEDLTFA